MRFLLFLMTLAATACMPAQWPISSLTPDEADRYSRAMTVTNGGSYQAAALAAGMARV